MVVEEVKLGHYVGNPHGSFFVLLGCLEVLTFGSFAETLVAGGYA